MTYYNKVLNIGLSLVLSTVFMPTQAQALDVLPGDFDAAIARVFSKENLTNLVMVSSAGQNLTTVKSECDPKRLDELVDKNKTSKKFYTDVKAYFKRCNRDLTKGGWRGPASLVKFAQNKYPFFEHSLIKPFQIPAGDGVVVPAVLALKPGSTPRPLVIVKLGVFSPALDVTSARNYMMHLYDQTPFHVVFLANQTGLDYIATNKRVSLGGWSEGAEALQAAIWLKNNEELSSKFSSMHLMGISLGGNAAVFGAAYNDAYKKQTGIKIFNSVTAICPVITLKNTLDKLYQDSLVGSVFYKFTKDQFINARDYVVDVPDLLKDSDFPETTLMGNYIGFLASTSLQRRGIASTTDKFLKSNNFWNLQEKLETPLLVWASKDDMVVRNEINAAIFEKDTYYSKESPYVDVLNMDHGNHCAFSSSYGMASTSAVLRTQVLQHSPEFQGYWSKKMLSSTFPKPHLKPSQRHLEQEWKFVPQRRFVYLTYKIFDSQRDVACEELDPTQTVVPNRCTFDRTYLIPFSEMAELKLAVPKNETEAAASARDLNSRTEFVSQGRSINGTRANAYKMIWRGLAE